MKIYHFADVHGEDKNHNEIKKCVDHMISNAKKDMPDVVVCSGDIINSKYLQSDSKSLKFMASYFRELSDICPVIVVTGTESHEGMIPEVLRNVSGKHPIHVSTTAEQVYLMEYDPNPGTILSKMKDKWITDFNSLPPEDLVIKLVVTQIPPPTKENWKNRQGIEDDNKNISQAMGSLFADFGLKAKSFNCPHILNGHFSVQGCKISETQLLPGTDISINTETLSMANADVCCLGHIHIRQEYNLPHGKKAFHVGSIFRKNFGERNEDKGFYLHEINSIISDSDPEDKILNKRWTESFFIKTPTRSMIQIDYNCVKDPDIINDQFESKIIDDVLKQSPDETFWAKVVIDIYIDDIRKINQSKIKQSLKESGAENVVLEINRARRENSREENILKAETLPDKVKALADHRSQPMPEGIDSMLVDMENLNKEDLVKHVEKYLDIA